MSDMQTVDAEATEPEHSPFGASANGPEPQRGPAPNRTGQWIAGGVAAAVIGFGGFFGVTPLTSHTSAATASAGPLGGPGRPGGPGGGLFGTITSIDGSNLVITTPDGATETVTTTSATKVTRMVDGSPSTIALSQLTVGQPVRVTGATNNGAVAATAIEQGGGPGGPGRPGAPGGPPPAP